MATGSESGDRGTPSTTPRRLGRYTLLKRIAKGGMGEVLLAATSGIEGAERPVIVKMIREEHRTDASFRARFLDEARVQAQLAHSGVASILDVYQAGAARTGASSGHPRGTSPRHEARSRSAAARACRLTGLSTTSSDVSSRNACASVVDAPPVSTTSRARSAG